MGEESGDPHATSSPGRTFLDLTRFIAMNDRASRMRPPNLAKAMATLGAACLFGMGVAAAAIGLAPGGAIDPGLRTLTAQSGIRLSPAFGPDDEDCLYASQRVVSAASAARDIRELVCNE